MMFYKEDEVTPYQPQMNRPDYSRCSISFKDREVCPYCGVKTRKESR